MKKLLLFLLILGAVLSLTFGCGCSNVLTMPAFAQNAKDVWPAFYGVDNGGPDEGWMVFWDQSDTAWDAPRLIDNDLLADQWTPQRQGIGWSTAGEWGVAFIEATGNDLEYWSSGDAGWQDEVGAWGMVDNDNSENWEAVDVEARQNWVWAGVFDPTPQIGNWYINLAAGVPTWTNAGGIIGNGTAQYSIVLDRNLYGGTHIAYIDAAGALLYEYNIPTGQPGITIGITIVDAVNFPAYPQIIADNEERMWVFYTSGNLLYTETQSNTPNADLWLAESVPLYTANTLTADYHATWLKMDDTIHVALVDQTPVGNTLLIYLRRTANGWDAPVTLLTADGTFPAPNDGLTWPQITVDKFGSIFIYYIFIDEFVGDTGRDLQGFYLDKLNYSNPVPGNWVRHLDIDASADEILWVVAPDSVPIDCDM